MFASMLVVVVAFAFTFAFAFVFAFAFTFVLELVPEPILLRGIVTDGLRVRTLLLP